MKPIHRFWGREIYKAPLTSMEILNLEVQLWGLNTYTRYGVGLKITHIYLWQATFNNFVQGSIAYLYLKVQIGMHALSRTFSFLYLPVSILIGSVPAWNTSSQSDYSISIQVPSFVIWFFSWNSERNQFCWRCNASTKSTRWAADFTWSTH